MKILLCAGALLLGFSLQGCKKNIQTNEAVRQGVVKHLSKNTGLSLTNMDVEIANATFRENEVDALVAFKPKVGDASAGMKMRYTLERKGDEWVVKSKADSGAGHAGTTPPDAGGLPPNHPPMGSGAPKK